MAPFGKTLGGDRARIKGDRYSRRRGNWGARCVRVTKDSPFFHLWELSSTENALQEPPLGHAKKEAIQKKKGKGVSGKDLLTQGLLIMQGKLLLARKGAFEASLGKLERFLERRNSQEKIGDVDSRIYQTASETFLNLIFRVFVLSRENVILIMWLSELISRESSSWHLRRPYFREGQLVWDFREKDRVFRKSRPNKKEESGRRGKIFLGESRSGVRRGKKSSVGGRPRIKGQKHSQL